MKVLSLFDGMACGYIALKNIGVNIERYIAYEIDKYAVQTATHNFPDIEERGDVFDADFSEYVGFDLIVGGGVSVYALEHRPNEEPRDNSKRGWMGLVQPVSSRCA